MARAASQPASAARKERKKWEPKLSENLADVRPETLRWLKQLGCKHVIFQGTPRVEGDTGWGHIGRTYSHGYMRALVQAVNAG